MAKKETYITVDRVSFSYERTPVLKDISFKVGQGDYLGIIGPNGGGKSTLIRLILGLLKPSAGSIRILGKGSLERSHHHFIGYVPQRMAAAPGYFPATVEEVVRSGRYAQVHCRECPSNDETPIEEAIGIAGIEDLKGRLIGDLSGGQRQRVLIARALARKPKILILDEPLAGVDVGAQEKFYEFLTRLNQDFGLTILFVTHDLDVIAKQAGYVLCLNERLICHQRAADFVQNDYLKEVYGDQVKYVVHHD